MAGAAAVHDERQHTDAVLLLSGEAEALGRGSEAVEIGEPQQPAQASSSLLLRFEAVVIAGAVVSAAPAEPQRAIRGALSFDRRSTGRLLQG
jgi:hypothetical protein